MKKKSYLNKQIPSKQMDNFDNTKYNSDTNFFSNNIFNSNPFDEKEEKSLNLEKNMFIFIDDNKDNNEKEKNEFLNKKVKREQEEEINININNKEDTDNNDKVNENLTNLAQEKKRFGRKNDNDTQKGKHNKRSDDNIINKIKGYFLNTFLRKYIQKHAINHSIEIKKLPNIFISNLKKSLNERLFHMKISDILDEQEISSKYST